MPKYKTHKVKDFKDYIQFIEKYCKQKDILFRGQREDKELIPKIARINLIEKTKNTEKVMLKDFKMKSLPLLDFEPKTNWEWLAIAQHHGMATRLLDWTKNPLAALWFAVKSPPSKSEIGEDMPGVIWILYFKLDDIVKTNKFKPFNITKTMVFRPRYLTQRLVAQDGWFTIHFLTKLVIPPSKFHEMRNKLDRFNINKATLFPDLDGLCSHIQWQNSLLEDEVEGK
jgi:hypothetical protein